jgi:F-type H+-transporting ATPase subunit b
LVLATQKPDSITGMGTNPMVVAASGLIKVVPGLMIWTLIAFGLTFFVLRRYAFAPVQKAIDERRNRIRQSLLEADRAREEARKLLEQHKALIGEAKTDAEEILADARRVAESQRQRLREETEADRVRRLEETRRQIEAETQRALAQIRTEVAELTLLATEKVARKTLDEADQRRLIDEAISELDFSVLEHEEAGST